MLLFIVMIIITSYFVFVDLTTASTMASIQTWPAANALKRRVPAAGRSLEVSRENKGKSYIEVRLSYILP